jgi:hypothetical protein
MSPKIATFGVVLSSLVLSPWAAAQSSRPVTLPSTQEKIVNGAPTAGFPSVGLFLSDHGTCTATLIGCSTVLTAAHCICTDPDTLRPIDGARCLQRADLLSPTKKSVYFHHAGQFQVASVAVNPGFVFTQSSDLAVLRLATPVTGIAPSPIETVGTPPTGTSGIIVGFGLTEQTSSRVGIKRTGPLTVSLCPPSVNAANHVCATLEAPIGSSSGTCYGDSGGPLFVHRGSELAVAGAASGLDSSGTNCTPPNHFFFADVYKDQNWIIIAAGGDLGTSACGGLPAAGGPGATVSGATGLLSPEHPSDDLSLVVPPGVSHLRVGLSAELPYFSDLNLYVKRGGAPTTSDFDFACERAGSGALAFCDLPSPAADTWHFLVNEALGFGGSYQLVTTLFSQSGTIPCARNADTACLQNDRFEIKVTWNNNDGAGTGKIMSFGGQRAEGLESAFYSFQTPTNFEMGVKVLNACIPAFGNKYWVFISGLTDQGWQVTIRDTQTGAIKTYSNDRGHLSTTFADTAAFDCS